MFLNTRLFSGPPAAGALVLGAVFVAGMLAGAALKARAPTSLASVPEPPAVLPQVLLPQVLLPQASAPGLQDLRLARGGHAAEVLRVNDGDTFEARVHVWPGMQVTTKVRLRGIDAAEFSARCPDEYRLAAAARDALQRMLAAGDVTISQIGLDKYGGRVLASAATRSTPDISEALLKTGLVRAYDGGRRDGWCR